MPLSVKVEKENRFLTKYLITEKDNQGEDVPAEISREQIKNKIRNIVKKQKEYSVSVLIDGRWRSGKTFDRHTFDTAFDENKHIFSNTEWYNDNYYADPTIYAVRIYEYE